MPDDRDSAGPGGAGPLDKLSRDLVKLARTSPGALARRVAELTVREQAELALRLPPSQRLELLLHAPRPLRLVRSIPDADLYLTVRDIGPTDAMPLLALASPEQIRHLVDLEAWRRDRFDAARAGAWVALLVETGEPATRRFLRHIDDELLVLLLQSWVRVEQIHYEDTPDAHGHGESETGSERGWVTPDGDYRFSPAIPEHAPAVGRLLRTLYVDEPGRYQELLWRALHELPSEMEEGALHWRQSRMEEHGFPSWDEALSVYAPPEGSRVHPVPPPPVDRDGLASARSLLPVSAGAGPLLAAVDSMPGDRREVVLHGLVSLANRLLVADHEDLGAPEAHRRAMRRAAAFVTIGLARRGATDATGAARVMGEIPIAELFREGHAPAAELQRRARDLFRSGWAAGVERAAELLDAPIRQRIESLLAPRPLYWDSGDEGEEARDFERPEELDEALAAVRMAEVVGEVLVTRMGLDPARLVAADDGATGRPVRFGTVFLTILAWHAVRGELRGDPLPPDVSSAFLRDVASRRTADPDAPDRALMRLVEELAERLGLDDGQRSVIWAFGRYALERLAEECGSLDPGIPLEPAGVSCLIVEP